MKKSFRFLTITILAGALLMASFVPVAIGGEITGKVTLKGTPKKEITINLGPTCGPLNKNTPTTRHYVVGKGGGLANVFVYVKGAKEAPPVNPASMLDQVGCMYQPYVFGVVKGEKFKIRTSDATLHNVHATPKVNKEFNFAQVFKGQENEKSFSEPEVAVRVKCDVHPWMFCYIGVFENPYFAVTDGEGNFKISRVPDGDYTLVAWHVKTHRGKLGLSNAIKVKGAIKQDFTVDITK